MREDESVHNAVIALKSSFCQHQRQREKREREREIDYCKLELLIASLITPLHGDAVLSRDISEHCLS